MNAAQRAAANTYAKAMGAVTPEQSRHVWLAVSNLVMSARDAEQAAFLAMSEMLGNGNPVDAADFSVLMRGHLTKVHEQLKFISGVLNGSAKE